MTTPTARTHRVTLEAGYGSEPVERTVEAAYYAHDGDFTVFKNAEHAFVASFKNDHLLSVVVEATP